jgi:hypothetical protein
MIDPFKVLRAKVPEPIHQAVPGQSAGEALEGLDRDKTATQLFYEYSGHGRVP